MNVNVRVLHWLKLLRPPKSGRPLSAVDTGSTVAVQTYMSTCCVSDCVTKK